MMETIAPEYYDAAKHVIVDRTEFDEYAGRVAQLEEIVRALHHFHQSDNQEQHDERHDHLMRLVDASGIRPQPAPAEKR